MGMGMEETGRGAAPSSSPSSSASSFRLNRRRRRRRPDPSPRGAPIDASRGARGEWTPILIYVVSSSRKRVLLLPPLRREAGSDPIVGSRDLGPTWVKNGALPCESGNSDEPCENTPGGIKRIPSDTFFSPPASLTDARFLGPSLIADRVSAHYLSAPPYVLSTEGGT